MDNFCGLLEYIKCAFLSSNTSGDRPTDLCLKLQLFLYPLAFEATVGVNMPGTGTGPNLAGKHLRLGPIEEHKIIQL